jgi:3-mercaptopyruvate sulfurtransferase SseA
MAEHSSARAALDLDRLGVKGVKALAGGFSEWTSANYPLAKGPEPGGGGRSPKR